MAAVAESAPLAPAPVGHASAPAPAGPTQREVKQLVDLLSKLNPSAKEFYPSSKPAKAAPGVPAPRLSADAPVFVATGDFPLIGNGNGLLSPSSDGSANGNHGQFPRRRNGFAPGKRRSNERARRAEKEESVRRTVYVADIDHTVTEETLAEIFAHCGQVVDCRICGDPNSVLRFAFIEFSDEDGARVALNLGGTMLGFYPVKVLPSKTAILPVNPKFLPKTEDEKDMVVRTIYCTNIDKKVTQLDVKVFFERLCGEVSRLRLLGDNVHSTRIAFVEFVRAESAIVALNCSGMILGELPVRVSPSKTPVRPRLTRPSSH